MKKQKKKREKKAREEPKEETHRTIQKNQQDMPAQHAAQLSQQSPQKLDSFSKISSLTFHTKTFFSKVEHEKDYLPILFTFVIITAITSIAQFIISLKGLLSLGSKIMISQAFSTTFGIAFAFAVPFILASFIHLGVLLLGGRQGFFNTFKPTTYAVILGALYSLGYFIIINIYNLIVPLDLQAILNIQTAIQSGTISYADLAPLKIRLGIMLVISLISIIHTLYASTVGIAKFQNMKKWKAFIAAILFPVVIMLLIIGAIIYIGVLGASSIPGAGG